MAFTSVYYITGEQCCDFTLRGKPKTLDDLWSPVHKHNSHHYSLEPREILRSCFWLLRSSRLCLH